MILWRIATETREYRAIDLSGAGAARDPGRWNAAREPVVYCAPTIAIAVLETAACSLGTWTVICQGVLKSG